jgi:hypothetical protein
VSRKPKDRAEYQSSKAARAALGDHGWVHHTTELLNSPVWNALTLSAWRGLRLLEREHSRHAGRENGFLILTYKQWEEAGIKERFVKEAIDLLCEVGLVQVTRQGRYPGILSMYRLTYLHWKFVPIAGLPYYLQPTNEWRNYKPLPAPTPRKDTAKTESQPPPGGS